MVEKPEPNQNPSPQKPGENKARFRSEDSAASPAWFLGIIPRKRPYLNAIYDNLEEKRIARTLFHIVIGLFIMYLVIVGISLYAKDQITANITLAGAILQILPLWLIFRGHVDAAGLFVVLTGMLIVTTSSTLGQGIHDIGIVAYPLVVMVASLLLRRRNFYIVSALTLVMIGWLVFGEKFGLYTPIPYDPPGVVDFVVVAAILLLAMLALDSLARNLRESLRLAKTEILQRKELESKLRYESIHDALTGIYNRAFFEEELARLDKEQEFPVSIIISDVDGLKTVNDVQGHAVGDELLKHMSSVLRGVFRTSDILARIGGDEFAILLPKTDQLTVERIVARAQARLEEHNKQYPDLPIHLSLGDFTAEKGSLADAFVAADQRMYSEKATGKSRRNLLARQIKKQ